MLNIFFIFSVFYGFCLSGCWTHCFDDDADMRVVLAPALGVIRDAHFRGRVIPVNDIREDGESTLFEVVKREMLAGHYFIPAVFESGWDDDAWWSEGVRDALTYTKSFFSEQLDVCIAAIAQAVRNDDKGLRVCLGGSLTSASCDSLLPHGKMRRWSIVPECKVFSLSPVRLKDRLFIVLDGCRKALEGVLCDRSQEYATFSFDGSPVHTVLTQGSILKDCCADSDATHLLALSLQRAKRKGCRDKAQEAELRFSNPIKCVSVTAQKDHEHQFSMGPWNVRIMYSPAPGVWRSGLFDCTSVSVNLQCQGWSAEKLFLSALQEDILCGLKHKDRGISAPEDIRTLKRPEVRDITCRRVDRHSPLLQEALSALASCWYAPGFRAKSQTLQRYDMPRMVDRLGKILWTIVDEEEDWSKKNFFKETVLVTVKGTGVTLKGQKCGWWR